MTALSSGQALRMAQHALFGSDTAQIDAELLLSAALGATRAGLYALPERQLTPAERGRFEALLERRILGEPVAYLLEEREFWTLRLRVTPAVLIPRPETELLVETALALAAPKGAEALRVADLGTGSGAIALSLASERPHWQVLATDQSAAALQVASDNAVRLGIRNVGFRQGSWCEALPEGQLDLILSNPPYIAPGDEHLGQGDLRFEPASALVAAEQGLADLQAICNAAPRHLAPGGWMLLEHGFEQGPAVRQLLAEAGFSGVRTLADLNELPRVTLGCLEIQGD